MKSTPCLADQLRTYLADFPYSVLPSIRELSRQWNVSYTTMMKAVRVLVNEGAVACSQGRRPVVVRSGGNIDNRESRMRNDAAGVLAGTIRIRINDGTLLAGAEMPKVNVLATSEHAAPATVVEAFRILSREGIIHKSGKKWIAGPAPRTASGASPSITRHDGQPTVLLLTTDGFSWHEYFSAGHTIPFSAALNSEVLKSGFRLSIAFVNKVADRPPTVPAGREEIERFIQSLGDRYRGTLFYGHPPFGEAVQEVLYGLLPTKQPIIFFDAIDACPDFMGLLSGFRGKGYRLHFDESAAVRTAVDTLCGLGHEVLGVPLLTGAQWLWAPRRLASIQRHALSMPHPPQIVSAPLHEPFWRFDDYTEIGSSLRNLEKGGGRGESSKGPRSIARMLWQATPSLASILDRKVTALIALNDRMAREFLVWFRAAGIRVPQHLSLISFDNLAQSAVFPITSIDFGFAGLGHLAAHIFIGDTPARADMPGNVPGVCRLVDRGSVGEAIQAR